VSDNGVVTAPEGSATEVAKAFAASDPDNSRGIATCMLLGGA
jgi:hypothetical protein